MRKIIPALLLAVLVAACTPLERQAYETVVASKAFLDSVKAKHPECATGATATVCIDLAKATAAKDALIDAVEIYCAGPDFNSGKQCNPPAKGSPAAVQATAKVQAALAAYNQTATDLKGVL
jgi:hypothetical protein